MKGVIGIDEVGRGPLAGPITVCACYIQEEKKVTRDIFHNFIRDSKKINKSLRNNIYSTIRYKRYLNTYIIYAVSSRSAAHIDKHGISKSTEECLLSCIRSLSKKGVAIEECMIRLDAGLTIPLKNLRQKSFIKGDERFACIALASIVAKESRDGYMRKIAKKHADYGWESNVGYGTRKHVESIIKIGITKFHRKSYLKGFKLFEKPE